MRKLRGSLSGFKKVQLVTLFCLPLVTMSCSGSSDESNPVSTKTVKTRGDKTNTVTDKDAAASDICTRFAAYDKLGNKVFGTRDCALMGSATKNCTADGEVGCVTTATYKSVDTSAISSWDIRAGKTAGGIWGNLEFFKNMAAVATYDRTAGTSASSGLDIYDTIDDKNGGGAFPTENPGGWTQATGQSWLRDSLSDNGAGGGAAANGACEGSEECVLKDRIAGMMWARDDGATRTWEAAITYCDGLSYGGYTDWRLPTQKELMQAYNDGVWSQMAAGRLALTTTFYWSSSTASDLSGAWFTYLAYGFTDSSAKTNSHRVMCTR